MLLLLIVCFVSVNLALAYIYRQDMIGDHTLMIITSLTASVCVYIGMVALGVPYNLWQPMSIFVIAGLFLGLQGARVAIRLRRAEKSNAQSRPDDST